MAWPTNKPNTNKFSSDESSIKESRPELSTMSQAVNDIVDYVDTSAEANGYILQFFGRVSKTITAFGDAVASSAEAKYGSQSIALDGTGDYLSIASTSDFGFGTGDFTIEAWFYKTAVATKYLFDTRTTLTENSVAVQSNGGGNLRLFVNGAFVLTSSNNHTNNAWNHLAISRASGVTRFFINGVVSTNTYTDTTDYGTAKPFVIGAQYNGTTAFAGYIDEFRVTKGVARYTTTFTPPTSALANDSTTVLLINAEAGIVDVATGKLEYVPNSSSIQINSGAGITVDQESAGGYNIEFSGSYTTPSGNSTYDFETNGVFDITSTANVPRINSVTTDAGIVISSDLANRGTIAIIGGTNGNIELEPHGSGKVRFNNAYSFPTADGSLNQVLQTNGAGQLSFASVSASGLTNPLNADLQTDQYKIIGSNGQLSLFVDATDSTGGQIQIGNQNGFAYFDDDGQELHGNGQLTLFGGTSSNSQIFIDDGAFTKRVYVRGTDNVEINRIQIRDNLAASATVGQVLRVAAINQAGVFNNNDVVDLEFATIAGGSSVDITAGNNIAVTQPDSTGAFEIALAEPLTNPINVNDQTLSNPVLKGYAELVYTGLSTSGTLTPAVSDGNVQTVTLSGGITINALGSPANGDSVTLIIRQPASGGPHTLSSTMKFAGGTKTLSTAANAIDVLSIFYDGTDYLASLGTNFS